MNLNNLQPNTPRKAGKRIGRGGKRGTYSGKGMKGQKSRAGAGIKPGFRGGDNRVWQLFPKQRGASKKPGGSGNTAPHRKHRFFQLRHTKPGVVNLDQLNRFSDGEVLTPDVLVQQGLVSEHKKRIKRIKILSEGELKRKLEFKGFEFSKLAKEKILKAGSTIK